MTVRILHVVRQMNAGGIAVWLMNVLRHVDHSRYSMDFMVVTEGSCAYGDEIRRLGGQIIPCYGYHWPWRFARRFRAVLREYGPYDVVHSHIYNYSGFVLMLAAAHRVPVRIAHSHTDTRLKEASLGPFHQVYRRAYLDLTKAWIRRYATVGLAPSRGAADALFGPKSREDPRFRVLPLGLDFTPFATTWDRLAARAELGLPPDALVVGHVGNYVWHKNHDFLIQIAADLLRRNSAARLLLVGHGLADSPLPRQVADLGIADGVVIAGPRHDVPRLMCAAMDVFLFPSHYEGLGLVVLEAQAAGLPCVLTDSLPTELDVVAPLIRRMPLAAPPETWAAAVLEAARAPGVRREEALARILASDFQLDNATHALTEIYEARVPHARPADVPTAQHAD